MNDIQKTQAAVIRAAWAWADRPDHLIARKRLIDAVRAHKEIAREMGAEVPE